MTNGPVETHLDVFEDFMLYQSGIYEHAEGELLGGHAVKMIGWGVENGTQYWICANSWSEKWGENGFFRIKQKNSGIDGGAVAGEADVNVQ